MQRLDVPPLNILTPEELTLIKTECAHKNYKISDSQIQFIWERYFDCNGSETTDWKRNIWKILFDYGQVTDNREFKLKVKIHYETDIERIVSVLKSNGYEVTPEIAYRLWKRYSASYAAGFLALPDDDKILLELVVKESV